METDRRLSSLFTFVLRSRSFQILWITLFVVVLFFYYRLHPPLFFAAQNLIPLWLALVHLLAISGLGWPLARLLLRNGTHPRSLEFYTSIPIGMGLTGILSFSLGLMRHFDPILFLLWESAGIVLFTIAVVQWRPFQIKPILWSPWETMGAAILLLFIVLLIPFVVAPDISTDSIAYHLLIPKLYLLRGEVYHLPLFVEAYYPSLAEYNYLPLLLLTNDIVCKSFHFWIGIILLFFLGTIVRTVKPGSGRLLAPALFLSMPVTAIHIGWAWNDFMYTFFVLLSLFYLFLYHKSDKLSGRPLLVAGILAGLSSWLKYTFVLYFFTSLIFFFFGYRFWRWRPRHFYFFFAGIALIAPFWLLQNWIFTENPFYPFLNGIFQSPYWTENSDRYFHNALRRWEIADWSWTTYLTFPVHITMKARLVDIQTGVLPLLLIPLLFLKSANAGVRFLKLYVAACMFVWLFIHTENRSIFTVFAALFCVAAVALEEFPWQSKRIRNMVIAGILVAVTTNFFYSSLTIYHVFDPFRYFLGRETAQQYISRLSESQSAFDYLNRNDEVRGVLLVSSHVPYYLNRPFFFSSFADPPVAEVLSKGLSSSQQIVEKFRKLGITHVMLNRSEYQRENEEMLYSWSKEERLRFEEFLLQKCEPLIRFGQDYVFRLK